MTIPASPCYRAGPIRRLMSLSVISLVFLSVVLVFLSLFFSVSPLCLCGWCILSQVDESAFEVRERERACRVRLRAVRDADERLQPGLIDERFDVRAAVAVRLLREPAD